MNPITKLGWVLFSAMASISSIAQDRVNFNQAERHIIAELSATATPKDPSNRFSDNPDAAHLGQYLFFDARFSANGTIACVTCHQPDKGFADGRQLAEGLAPLTRHSMSLWQVAFQRWFFWDGRADSLWSQALQPFEDPREMDTTRLSVLHKIACDPQLRNAYEACFGPLPPLEMGHRFPQSARPVPNQPQHPHHQAWLKMTKADRQLANRAFSNVGKAIAAYERRLISINSPFDQFARALTVGQPTDKSGFSPKAQRGLKLFIGKANCRLCHNGPNFSDGEFHNNGVPPLNGGIPKDAGRWEGIPKLQANPFNATGRYSDAPEGERATAVRTLLRQSQQWGQFRTPSLRQVGLSAPFMHQGQFLNLTQVVRFYARLDGATTGGHHREPLLQPLDLSDDEIEDLVAFLHSLTSPTPSLELMQKPNSPLR